jgi:hypothetical protein
MDYKCWLFLDQLIKITVLYENDWKKKLRG